MRKYIVIFSILTAFNLSAQNKIAFSKLVKDTAGIYTLNETPYTGESLILWPSNNKPMQRVEWQGGRISGTFESWYEDGKQDQIVGYKEGVRDGEFKTFYTNGAPEVHCKYKKGTLDGAYMSYERSGTRQKQVTFVNGVASS